MYFLLAVFDAGLTAKRLPTIGIEAEYNPVARWLAYKLGVKAGIFLSVLIPTAGIILIGWNNPRFLCFMLGCRTVFFGFQLRTIFAKSDTRAIEVAQRIVGPYEGPGVLRYTPILRPDQERR
jgi:hypothetical protein